MASSLPELKPVERALLQAALSPDAAVVASALAAWQRASVLDALPAEQSLLLPRMHANLTRLGLQAGVDARLSGTQRRAWVQTQQQMALAERVLSWLTHAGVTAWLADDAAAVRVLDQGPGERAVERLVCYLPDDHLDLALEIMLTHNWQPSRPLAQVAQPAWRRWQSELSLTHPSDPPLALRWRLTPGTPCATQPARLAPLLEAPPGQPACLDHLCLLVLAGERYAQGGRARLSAAADLVLARRLMQAHEWPRLVELAALLGAARSLLAGLRAVAPLLAEPCPELVIGHLEQAALGELPGASRPLPVTRGVARWAGLLRYHWGRWRRLARANGQGASLVTALAYLLARVGDPGRRLKSATGPAECPSVGVRPRVQPRNFVIYAQPRTGSNLLRRLLDSHPAVQVKGEVYADFNWRCPRRPWLRPLARVLYHLAQRHPSRYAQWLAWRGRPAARGFKVFNEHLPDAPALMAKLAQDDWLIIHLQRRDLFAVALSHCVLMATSYWGSYDPGQQATQSPVLIPPAQLLTRMRQCLADRLAESRALAALPHFSVVYEEDLLDDASRQRTGERIFTALGVAPRPVSTNWQRTWERPYSEWITNYAELRALLTQEPALSLLAAWQAAGPPTRAT